MTTSECATDIAPPETGAAAFDTEAGDAVGVGVHHSAGLSSERASKPLKGFFFGFAATITIGLALASWYVGVRIVAADEIAPPANPVSANRKVTPVAPPEAQAPPAAAEDSMAEAFWYTVPPANLYLQVAGLGPEEDADFVDSLKAKGFPAQVQAQGQSGRRILIGPFSTRSEMEQGQRRLQTEGVLAVETAN
jgi:cell division septation protein DedD